LPFVSNAPDDEQKTDPTLAPQGGVSPTGGGSATVRLSPSAAVAPAGGGGAGSTPGTAPTPAAGGQFASLNQYITANQGQAAPLAGKLTPSINQEYGNLDTASNAAIANINKQVANAPGYTASNPDVLAQEAANPASFTNDPNNVKQFQSLLQNTYSGPASAEGTSDYANQQAAINKAIATGTANTTTEAGRENLLAQNEATPTSGVTALNSAILSQDPNALATVENAYKPFQNLLTNLKTGAQGVNQTISQEQADAAASSKAASDAINSQIAALNTGVGNELSTAQQKAATQNATVANELKGIYGGAPVDTAATTLGTYGGGSTPWVNTTNYNVNNLTPGTAAALGLTPDQTTQLQDALRQAATSQLMRGHNFDAGSGTSQIDLSQFLTQRDPNAVINAANAATPEDYAKAQAFQTLLQGMNLQTPAAIINPATASQAGTAPTNLNAFDYQTALNTAQGAAANERKAAQDEAAQLTGAADLAHAQSQHGGGFFNALKNAVTTPINTIASAANPVSWIPNVINLTQGKGVSPTNMGQQYLKRAHGGVITNKEELHVPFKKLVDNLHTGAK
jgi:hypothetical protein